MDLSKLIKEFHSFWDRAYSELTRFVSDPTTKSSPIAVDFYEIGERGYQVIMILKTIFEIISASNRSNLFAHVFSRFHLSTVHLVSFFHYPTLKDLDISFAMIHTT